MVVDMRIGLAPIILAFLVHCGGGSGSPAPVAQATPPAAGLDVYVYTDIVTSPSARQAFYTFALPRNVRRVYLQAAGILGSSNPALADFVQDAGSRGIAVALLFGQADWTLTANQAQALQYATQSQAFVAQLQASGSPAPDAVQFDVEPYTLPQWDTDLQGTANQDLDLLASLHTQLNGQPPLLVATAYWLDGTPVTRNGQTRAMSEWILDAVDGTVIMDYRNTAQGILTGAANQLAYASTQGKPVILAVDVQCGSDSSITFCGEGEAFMFGQMAIVAAGAQSQASFHGMGVFNYEDWATLGP